MNYQDIAVRAGKTFLQAFLAVLIAAQFSTVPELFAPALWEQAAVAGTAAAISALQNILTNLDW